MSLDAPVRRRNDRPLMAGVGDQHNGGPSSGKAVLGTAREVDYLKVCHDALTDIWLLGDDTETGISWEEMFSKDPAAVVATCDFCASDRVNTFSAQNCDGFDSVAGKKMCEECWGSECLPCGDKSAFAKMAESLLVPYRPPPWLRHQRARWPMGFLQPYNECTARCRVTGRVTYRPGSHKGNGNRADLLALRAHPDGRWHILDT